MHPDSNQPLGQRWVIVGVVGNTSLLACCYLPNIGRTLNFNIHVCTVEELLLESQCSALHRRRLSKYMYVRLLKSNYGNQVLKIAFTLNVDPTQYLEENCWHYVGICKAYFFGLKTLD